MIKKSQPSGAVARAVQQDTTLLHRLIGLSVLTFVALMLLAFQAMAAQPLVSIQWLQENIDKPGIRFVDLQSPQGYQRAHLKGAVSSHYGQWRHKQPAKGSMMPPVEDLENLLGVLGIDNQTHVVLTPLAVNPSEIAVATRVYWTLKVLGHEKVSILDGGLIAYSKTKDPQFSNKPVSVEPKTYKAKPDLSMAPNAEEVLADLKKGVRFVDYRSEPEYIGQVGGPRRGTIPGSKNLHYVDFVEKGQGTKFLSPEAIQAVYDKHGISTKGPEIAFCNSAHRASLSWFVQHELLGNKEIRLYDGSMNEWGVNAKYPVEIPQN